MSRISDLMLRVGDAEAQKSRNSGLLWGRVASDIGAVPTTIAQMRQQEADRAQQSRVQESALTTAGLQQDNLRSEMSARDADRAGQNADRALAERTHKVNAWLTSLAGIADPEQQKQTYADGVAALKADGSLTPQDAPDRFPGMSWVKSKLTMTLPAAERFKALFPDVKPPEPYTLNPGDVRFGGDNQEVARVDKPAEPVKPVELNEGALLVDPVSGKEIARGRPKTFAPQSGGGSGDEAEAIADAIIRGEQPPDTTGLYRIGAEVRAHLAKKGYNQAAALTDWKATQRHLNTLNGAQQTRMAQSVDNAAHSLDVIDGLADQWKGGKFPLLNKAQLAVAKQGGMGPEAQKIAVALDAQIADVTSELGNVYMGGNSPTDHALSLAAKNLSADWSEATLKAMTNQARTNLQIRQNSMRNIGVAGASADNPYAPKQPAAGGGAQRKPIPGIPGGEAESTDGGRTWKRVK